MQDLWRVFLRQNDIHRHLLAIVRQLDGLGLQLRDVDSLEGRKLFHHRHEDLLPAREVEGLLLRRGLVERQRPAALN